MMKHLAIWCDITFFNLNLQKLNFIWLSKFNANHSPNDLLEQIESKNRRYWNEQLFFSF